MPVVHARASRSKRRSPGQNRSELRAKDSTSCRFLPDMKLCEWLGRIGRKEENNTSFVI